jgi:hypothetical protein
MAEHDNNEGDGGMPTGLIIGAVVAGALLVLAGGALVLFGWVPVPRW